MPLSLSLLHPSPSTRSTRAAHQSRKVLFMAVQGRDKEKQSADDARRQARRSRPQARRPAPWMIAWTTRYAVALQARLLAARWEGGRFRGGCGARATAGEHDEERRHEHGCDQLLHNDLPFSLKSGTSYPATQHHPGIFRGLSLFQGVIATKIWPPLVISPSLTCHYLASCHPAPWYRAP